uniref:Uncharacterized protein n=2 Tax=Oryza TaxID=4527 RepID=A0A0E0A4Z4_9ORYZ
MVAIVAPPPPSNHFPLFLDLERQQVGGGKGGKWEIDVSSCSVHPCRRHNSMARWLKLEKDDKRRLCQWWWRHWNAILVVILDMGIVKARRRWPTFTPCQNWINNDGNSSAGP